MFFKNQIRMSSWKFGTITWLISWPHCSNCVFRKRLALKTKIWVSMPEELECVNRATFKIHFNILWKINFLANLEAHCSIPTTNTHSRWINTSEETGQGDLFKTPTALRLFFIELFFLSNTLLITFLECRMQKKFSSYFFIVFHYSLP